MCVAFIARFLLILSVALCALIPLPVLGGDVDREYYAAEVYAIKFQKDRDRIKYRDNWFDCIQRFQEVYRARPDGAFAAASLYWQGKLYQGLYGHSFLEKDLKKATAIFERLRSLFPKSDYAPKAAAALKEIRGGEPENPEPRETASVYVKKKQILKPESSPDEQPVPAARVIRRKTEFRESKAAYRAEIGKDASASHEVSKLIEAVEKRAKEKPYVRRNGDAGRPAGEMTTVSGLRYWSNPNYTRIVVDADEETPYVHRMLDSDSGGKMPQRLYIDFRNSQLGENLDRLIPIDDDLLLSARAGQNTESTVRVVVDIKSYRTYKIFSLSNPFRTIIDVWGDEGDNRNIVRNRTVPRPKAPVVNAPKTLVATKRDSKLSPHDLATQLALGVRRIVIDAGHGGHDGGAPGYYKGVWEKDIVLQIAQRLARKVQQELNCEVILTRNSDRYLTLEERTAIANTRNADLFISIHCNASTNNHAYGMETYFLNLATDDDAILVAARENAISRKNISDLHTILNDLMQNSKINESNRLAGHVQSSLYSHMSSRYSNVKNKGVKQAPFYVLLGAQMPSILIETSFISNARECKRLLNPNYQEHLCAAIIQGIKKYIRETSPTALLKSKAASS